MADQNIDLEGVKKALRLTKNAATVLSESAKNVSRIKAAVDNGRMPSATALESIKAALDDYAEKTEEAVKLLDKHIEDNTPNPFGLPPQA